MNLPIGSSTGFFSTERESFNLIRKRFDLLSQDSVNALTPGYQAQGANFNMYLEKKLKTKLPADHKVAIMNMLNTESGSQRMDGNKVSPEATALALKDTESHYIGLTHITNKKFNIIKDIIKEIK